MSRQKDKIPTENLITRNIHVKYGNSSSLLKVNNTVKVFQKFGRIQCQNHRVNIVGTHGKVLSLEKLTLNIKALELTVRTL